MPVDELEHICEETIRVLQPLLVRPVLKVSLLSRPPFKLLFDIIVGVANATGFGANLYSREELERDYHHDKAGKIAFLGKAVDAVSLARNIKLTAKPNRIVCGLDAKETNLFLQQLAQAAAHGNMVRNAGAVEDVLFRNATSGAAAAGAGSHHYTSNTSNNNTQDSNRHSAVAHGAFAPTSTGLTREESGSRLTRIPASDWIPIELVTPQVTVSAGAGYGNASNNTGSAGAGGDNTSTAATRGPSRGGATTTTATYEDDVYILPGAIKPTRSNENLESPRLSHLAAHGEASAFRASSSKLSPRDSDDSPRARQRDADRMRRAAGDRQGRTYGMSSTFSSSSSSSSRSSSRSYGQRYSASAQSQHRPLDTGSAAFHISKGQVPVPMQAYVQKVLRERQGEKPAKSRNPGKWIPNGSNSRPGLENRQIMLAERGARSKSAGPGSRGRPHTAPASGREGDHGRRSGSKGHRHSQRDHEYLRERVPSRNTFGQEVYICKSSIGPQKCHGELLTHRLIDINFVSNAEGWRPLHHAAKCGHAECCRELVSRGCYVNVCDTVMRTPLHIAVFHGRYEAARALLDSGAMVDAQTVFGDTPLHIAAQKGYAELIDLLVHHGAEVYLPDSLNRLPHEIGSVRSLVSMYRSLKQLETRNEVRQEWRKAILGSDERHRIAETIKKRTNTSRHPTPLMGAEHKHVGRELLGWVPAPRAHDIVTRTFDNPLLMK